MMPDFEIVVAIRVRRRCLAGALLRMLALGRRCMPMLWFTALARAIVCRVAIVELRIGDDRWRRMRISPDEVLVA